MFKIKLTSNFQTIEFEVDKIGEEENEWIDHAIGLINYLGENVHNTPPAKNAPPKKKEELATVGQKKYLNGLNATYDENTLTKKDANDLIQKLIKG
mgnify:CR=1 FL=1|nr:MAG TPA: Protein of unknown function (DUF3072) [Bacteriophage sp.]